MHHDIERVLFSEAEIVARLGTLGEQIAKDYKGHDLVLMALLKGGVIFISDLMRKIPIHLDIDFIQASSYGSGTVSSGKVGLKVFPNRSFAGKRLLVLDDILDTGRTLKTVTDRLREQGAADVRTCVLLDKKARRVEAIEPDYYGFAVDDHFVVGYGLDFDDRYRNLPYIGILKEECYRNADA